MSWPVARPGRAPTVTRLEVRVERLEAAAVGDDHDERGSLPSYRFQPTNATTPSAAADRVSRRRSRCRCRRGSGRSRAARRLEGKPVQPYSWVTVPDRRPARTSRCHPWAAGRPGTARRGSWAARTSPAIAPLQGAPARPPSGSRDCLGLAFVGDELAVAGLLGLLDPLASCARAPRGGARASLQLRLAGLDLLAGLDRGAAQLVGAQARRGRHEAQGVEGLLVRGDVLGQLLVLVAVGEVGVGLAHDVGEGVGREDLLEQGRALGAVGLGEPLPEGLAAGAQVLLAADELLGQQAQRPVALAQLVHELVVAGADTVEALDGLLDATLDAGPGRRSMRVELCPVSLMAAWVLAWSRSRALMMESWRAIERPSSCWRSRAASIWSDRLAPATGAGAPKGTASRQTRPSSVRSDRVRPGRARAITLASGSGRLPPTRTTAPTTAPWA